MTLVTSRDHGGEYLTVADVAAELACSEPTVRRRIRAGLEAWLWSEPSEES